MSETKRSSSVEVAAAKRARELEAQITTQFKVNKVHIEDYEPVEVRLTVAGELGRRIQRAHKKLNSDLSMQNFIRYIIEVGLKHIPRRKPKGPT